MWQIKNIIKEKTMRVRKKLNREVNKLRFNKYK